MVAFCRDNEIPSLTHVPRIETAKVVDAVSLSEPTSGSIYLRRTKKPRELGNPRRKPLSRATAYWQRDKCRALLARIRTGNGASTRRRRVGEIYRRDLFFISSSLPCSSPRALWLAARFAESLRRKCDAPPHESGI